jgi:hypothetical protein
MPPRTFTLGSGSGITGPEPLTVPSGETCMVRRPGLQQLVTEGVLHDTDILTTIVQENIDQAEKGVEPSEVNYLDILKDKKKFEAMMHTTDRIVCAVVVKPKVLMVPNDVTSRRSPAPGEEAFIYADMIDLEDKMFIVNYAVGGSRKLEPFRAGPGKDVGAVPARKATSRPTKRTPTTRR